MNTGTKWEINLKKTIAPQKKHKSYITQNCTPKPMNIFTRKKNTAT